MLYWGHSALQHLENQLTDYGFIQCYINDFQQTNFVGFEQHTHEEQRQHQENQQTEDRL